MAMVGMYIADQREHHIKRSFVEEFIVLLKAHEIEFDEKYLFSRVPQAYAVAPAWAKVRQPRIRGLAEGLIPRCC